MIPYPSYIAGRSTVLCVTLWALVIAMGLMPSAAAQPDVAATMNVASHKWQSPKPTPIQLIYREVIDRLQTGQNRKVAYDLACKARDMAKTAKVSQIDSLSALYIHAYASQEFLDQHTTPYQELTKILPLLANRNKESTDLKRRIYHSLTAASLVLNKLDSAVYYADQANALGQDLYGDQSCERVKDYFLLAYSLIESGEDKKALLAANKSLQIAENQCSEKSPAFIDAHRLMGYYYVKSNYQATRALPFYEKALQNSLKIKDASRAFKSLYYICRTGILSNNATIVNNHISYFDSIQVIADNITGIKSQVARLDIEYTLARQQHNLELAIVKKNEFANLLKRKLPERRTAILDSYYAVLEMTIEQNIPSATKKYLYELIDFTNQKALHQDQLLSFYHVQALAYVHINEWEQAISVAKKGISALSKSYDAEGDLLPPILEISDLYFYRQFLKTCAAYYKNRHRSTKADEDLLKEHQYLTEIVVSMIRMIERDDERMSKQSIDEIAADFEQLIISNIELYKKDADNRYLNAAIQLTDMASNLTFFRGVNQRQSIVRTDEADSLINKKREITTELINLELAKNKNTIAPFNQDEELALDLRIALSRINLHLEDREPLYMAQVRSVHQIDIEKFQAEVLDSHTAFIQYFYYDHLYAFIILDDKISYVQLPISDLFTSKLEAYEQSNSAPNSTLDEFIVTSRSVAEILIDSVLNQLPDRIDRLLITPYGRLAHISFESLLVDQPNGLIDFGSLPYLIKKYAVSYAFSMTSLSKEIKRNTRTKNKSFLGIAPDYHFSNKNNSKTQQFAERTGPLPLPGARLEIKNIGKIIHRKKLLLGESATKEEVMRQMPNHAVWHFAMHAILNEDNPMLSALYFSADGQESSNYLTAAELYEKDLNPDMVVLSACNTGIGTFDYTQGPMSLARAFAYSGASSTILSIWPAPDHATSLFFPMFYRHLCTGMSKERALQQTKLQWLEDTGSDQFRHPYFWNAFTLWGSVEPLPYIKSSSTTTLTKVLVVIFFLIAGMIMVRHLNQYIKFL